MAWLSLGADIAEVPNAGQAEAGSQQVLSLCERIAEQYSAPFDALFDGSQAADGFLTTFAKPPDADITSASTE